MNYEQRQQVHRVRIGLATILVMVFVGAITIVVNSKPYWWLPCQLVHVDVQDATELKEKAPVVSMGMQIGYLQDVELFETRVRIGVCISSPVEVLPHTRAYVREKGFLGGKLLELKPVRYLGDTETLVN